jgi:probable rRNA maturation factor
VALVDDREIRRVHRKFLGDDTPTDVISFRYDRGDRAGGHPAGESAAGGPFGELVISAETAVREARARRIPPERELLRYAIHGLLHLLGHQDSTPSGRARMRLLEDRHLGEERPARSRARPRRAPKRRRAGKKAGKKRGRA